MSIDFWCKKHGARTTQDGKCDVCNIKRRESWSSDGELPSIEECQSVLKPLKDDVEIRLFIDGQEITPINADILKHISTEG